jgi:hypothetical protein
MKTSFSFLFIVSVISLTTTSGFMVVNPQQRASTVSLHGTFDGKGTRITVRDDEDAAMWIEEPKKKAADPKKKPAAAKKSPAAKKGATDKKAAAPAFKFPWQK